MADIWTFSAALSDRLLLWSALSVGSGVALVEEENEGIVAMGQQFAAWGAVDGAIALFGRWNNWRSRQADGGGERQLAESQKLRRLLWLNTFLDVFYLLGGVWLLRGRGATSAKWRGHALGIIVQGGFLFVFDWWHARRVPS